MLGANGVARSAVMQCEASPLAGGTSLARLVLALVLFGQLGDLGVALGVDVRRLGMIAGPKAYG